MIHNYIEEDCTLAVRMHRNTENSPLVLLALEIHISCRTRDRLGLGQFHNKLKGK